MVDGIQIGSHMRFAVLTMVLCVAGGCASSDAPDGPEGEQVVAANESAAAETADLNEMICRRERATGSHFSRRVCRTRAQIEA